MTDFLFSIAKEYRSPESIDVAIKLLEYYLSSFEKTIAYGKLCQRLKYDINPRIVEKMLGDVSFACKENGLPPISALVINQKTGIPGAGFFDAYYPGLKEDEQYAKFIEILNQILEYPHWDKVLEAYKSLQ